MCEACACPRMLRTSDDSGRDVLGIRERGPMNVLKVRHAVGYWYSLSSPAHSSRRQIVLRAALWRDSAVHIGRRRGHKHVER